MKINSSQLIIMDNQMKCKFHTMCRYYREDSFTCRRDEGASHYCGKYREIIDLGSS